MVPHNPHATFLEYMPRRAPLAPFPRNLRLCTMYVGPCPGEPRLSLSPKTAAYIGFIGVYSD